MKQLSALKLKDLVSTQLDLSEMGNLIGGIEGDIMLLAYGCESEVCRNKWCISLTESNFWTMV